MTGGNRKTMSVPRSSQVLAGVARQVAEFNQAVEDEPDRADREEGQSRFVEARPCARRRLAIESAPRGTDLREAEQRRRAVGVGAEQVDEQEDEADQDHRYRLIRQSRARRPPLWLERRRGPIERSIEPSCGNLRREPSWNRREEPS